MGTTDRGDTVAHAPTGFTPATPSAAIPSPGAALMNIIFGLRASHATAVAARWEPSHPAVARLLEEGVEDCLACLAFPLAHRVRIRTTNGLERLHEEIKRRTRVVRIFPNPEACLRLVTALCVEQSEEWVSGRRYLAVSDVEEVPAPWA